LEGHVKRFLQFFSRVRESADGILKLEFAWGYRKLFLKAAGKVKLIAKAERGTDRGAP
jgi:hypothetical protein